MAKRNSNITYEYQKPHKTYTLDQFQSCGSDTVMCYHNLSFTDIHNGIEYDTYNVFSDYLDEIKDEYCLTVVLTDDQLIQYMYRPKLLCWDIYGNTELAFMVVLINDMCSIKQFNRKKILMPKKDNMALIIKYIFNANKDVLSSYNKK